MPINLLGESLFTAAIMFSQAKREKIRDNVKIWMPTRPTDYCPKSVLFSNTIRTSAKRLFPANGQPPCIQKICEESPAYKVERVSFFGN